MRMFSDTSSFESELNLPMDTPNVSLPNTPGETKRRNKADCKNPAESSPRQAPPGLSPNVNTLRVSDLDIKAKSTNF